jgi:hypothetical protein
VPCRATHGPSSEGPEIRADGHVPEALDEIPKPVVVALLRRAVVVMEMIIGHSLTPLNSSRALRAAADVRGSAAVTTTRAGKGRVETARLRATAKAMGIEEVLTAPRAPWQNPFVERFIGSARRECFDHVIVFNEAGVRKLMTLYASYYNDVSYCPTFLCA